MKVKEHTSFGSMKAKDPLSAAAKDGGGNAINIEVAKRDGGFIRKGDLLDLSMTASLLLLMIFILVSQNNLLK